jgi:hypothetical protein
VRKNVMLTKPWVMYTAHMCVCDAHTHRHVCAHKIHSISGHSCANLGFGENKRTNLNPGNGRSKIKVLDTIVT